MLEEVAANLESAGEEYELTEATERFLRICAQSLRELAQQLEAL